MLERLLGFKGLRRDQGLMFNYRMELEFNVRVIGF